MKKELTPNQDIKISTSFYLKKGNAAFQAGEFESSIELYKLALNDTPEIADTIKFNIDLATRKLAAERKEILPKELLNKSKSENSNSASNEKKVLPEAMLRLDSVSTKFAQGWAIDKNNPESSVILRIDLDDKPYSIVETHLARNDVKKAHGGDGFSGFRAELNPYATYDKKSKISTTSLSHSITEADIKSAQKLVSPLLQGTHYKCVNKAASNVTQLNIKEYSWENKCKSVSVIILNLNGENVLKDCIESILKHNIYAEIIVIDHASTDNSIEMLKNFGNTRINVIERDKNYSYSDSNNFGASQAKGDILIFLNNDIILTSDSISEMASIINKNEFGLLGIKLWDLPRGEGFKLDCSEKAEQHLGVHFNGLSRGETIEAFETRSNSFLSLNKGILETPAVTAAMLAIKKEDFLKINGFSNKYFYGQEDVDFCLRFNKELDKKIGVLLDHGAYHIRGLSRKALSKDNKNYLVNNRQIIQEEQGAWFRKEFRIGTFTRPGFWNQKPLAIAMIVSEISFDTDKADFFTAKELGDALEADEKIIVGYFDRNSNYDMSGYDVVIVYIDGFDPRKLLNVSPHCIVIGWARNWFDRWCDRAWIEYYDILYASSELAQKYMSERLKRDVGLLRIAASNECLKERQKDYKYTSDYTFTGSYFESPREITDALNPEEIPFTFKLFGYNWEKLPHFGKYSCGSVSYTDIPSVYASTRLVIDDANIATKKWGALNCRIYDALAAGVLCITNNTIGIKEIFDEEYPTYSVENLNSKVSALLNNKQLSEQLAERYKAIVLEKHTYKNRKKQILNDIYNHVKRSKVAIKIAAPDFERAITWGDYHFARELRKELELLGYSVRIDTLDQWKGQRHLDDDINIVLRGLSRFVTRKDQINIMWLISHPDLVCENELRDYAKIFVASSFYSEKLKKFTSINEIFPLLQASAFDFETLDENKLLSTPSHEILFIGNSRNEYREVVRWCIEEDLPIAVYGDGWDNFIPASFIKGKYIDNDLIPYYYSKAKVVLNDHWEDMKRNGFISNRVMDVLAVNGTLLTDIPKDLNGHKNIYSYDDKTTFISILRNILSSETNSPKGRRNLSDLSFSNRAKILDIAIKNS